MLISNIQLSYLKNGAWNSFTNQTQNAMDGIKIQTPASSPFYLQYRTWNEGKTAFYSYVKSNVNDFAGVSGRPIQRLQIQAYKNDGTKLDTNVVVMYRAHVGTAWLPWVSNAAPEWMQSVFEKYHLDGSLDTSSYYAGNPNQNINGIQILVYQEEDIGNNFTGGEVSASLSYMVGDLSNWTSFNQGTYASQMDGIKIQTDANKNYHLSYKSWNEGNSSYYSEVSSTGTAYNDYAGLPGKAIQRLSIKAYRNDGTKLTSGVIVMYRAYVNGEWLPWVSNADPQWMRDVKNKYNLNGTLDVDSTYAGNPGQNISGVEIRIFEDGSLNAGSDNFSGSEIPLSLSYITNNLSNWTTFNKTVSASNIGGVKIQTDSTQSFYLMYKSFNQGNSSYYPEVSSTGRGTTDYAGYPGKTMQLLSIKAYDNNGTKLTSGVVIMYRVSVQGRWLPWVSNADPEWMQSVKRQYNLDGTLDTKSTYAGNSGQNIDGVEVRAFVGNTNYHPIEGLPGTESSVSLSYMKDSLSNWNSFSRSIQTSYIDGIKIQTSTGKPYYLSYKSWNSGKSSYYPEVKSTGTAYNDYAGLPGRPIQLLSIKVYRNDGVKLTTGVVVMYRAHVADRWLPWVSNADPEWMRSVQSKYGLGGTLDTSGYYAGNSGQNINGIEIRIFEEDGISNAPQTPVGKYKIINVPFIPQFPKYPNGCESVTAVMALSHIGINMTVDTFIDSYLDHGYFPFDPNISFGNDPRNANGYGCYTPVIKKALDKILVGKPYMTKEFKGKSLASLCSEYIDKDIPVIICATQHMDKWRYGSSWYYQGRKIQWISPMHCLLLVGYDDNNYIFNDPQDTKALTYYSKESVEDAYNGLFKQALVILRSSAYFGELGRQGYISDNDVQKTDDGFYMSTKSLADILSQVGINTLNGWAVQSYYDDWYPFAVSKGTGYTYSLLKLREQESDGGDGDNPGVAIPFVTFNLNTLVNCLNSATDANKMALWTEINHAVSDLKTSDGKRMPYDNDMKIYFEKAQSKAPYLVAEQYVKHLAKFVKNGVLDVPANCKKKFDDYKELVDLINSAAFGAMDPASQLALLEQKADAGRIPEALNNNNMKAGHNIYSNNKLYINNPNSLTIYEKCALLMSHTSNVTFNSFAAEVVFHADALDDAPAIFDKFYNSALRADMAIGEEYESGVYDKYYDLEDPSVKEQIKYHGEY